MSLKKSELIISIILVITVIFIGLNFSVFAAEETVLNMSFFSSSNSNQQIEMRNTNTNTSDSEIPKTNTINTPSENTSKANTKNENIANTGIEDLFGSASLTWAVIGTCVISAIFALKKVKEYNID